MRIALISPYSPARAVGNAVTATCISNSLGAAGCTARIFSLEEYAIDGLLAAVASFSPDLIHAFHAFHCGNLAQHIARKLDLPFIITMTGTDIYRADNYSAAEVKLLRSAAAIVVFTETLRQKLISYLNSEKISSIPQAVAIRSALPHAGKNGDFIFLLPAGLRPVKNVLFPLTPLARLVKKYPQIKLQLAGEIIDSTYAAEVLLQYDREPSASWLGSIAHDKMPEFYANASVVLNCSISEGGMANSLLEAMQLGIPVLAADIEGNRSLVVEGDNGLLYQDEETFLAKAERLLVDAELRSTLVHNGLRYVTENCSPAKEAASYIGLYGKVIRGCS
ncbi:MAG: glycosyltransferase family 4 protein [Geobacter sp.]|nr:glycosyltransferase family 4 protein [Geobacter sp.]